MSTKNVIKVFLYLALAFLLLALISVSTSTDTVNIEERAELDSFDFSSRIALLSPNIFDKYPEVLLTPEDFAAGTAGLSQRGSSLRSDFATYRLVLELEEGLIYGISGHSAPQAMTLWVNGDILYSAGTPGRNVEEMVGNISYFTSFFNGTAGYTEIVIQRSSFLHLQLGSLEPLYLGEQSLIVSMNNLAYIHVSIMIGILLVAVVFFFGIFIYLNEYRYFLWVTLFCLMIALRTLTRDYLIISEFLTQISWQSIHRISMISTLGVIAFITAYLSAFFSYKAKYRGISRIIMFSTAAVCGAFALFYALAPSTVYTQMPFRILSNVAAMVIPATAFVNAFWIMTKDSEKRKFEHIMIMIASVITFVLGAVEVYLIMVAAASGSNHLLVGSLLFIFVSAAAVAINLHRTDFAARETEMRLAAENAMLDSHSRIKSAFISDISHEIKSPLRIISGYAQLAELQINEGMADKETMENLRVVSEEAHRLAGLVERLLNISKAKEEAKIPVAVSVDDIISRAMALLTPVLAANNNRLDVSVEENCPPVAANTDMLLQVLFNLGTNANRHTKDSKIELKVAKTESIPFVSFTLSDKGSGIPSYILERIFERGVSGDNSSGLGLPICKEAVEAYGGNIHIESKRGKGTKVSFTLPIYEKHEVK